MNRKGVVIWLSFVLVFSLIVIIVEIAPVVEAPTTWYVDDVPGSGPGNPPEDFTSIQDAINASIDGDTVFVYNGTYNENVIVNKTINLTGEDKETTIIVGVEGGDVVTINVDWVNITGFTVTNGSTGIYIKNSSNNNVANNNITSNSMYGVYVYYSSENFIEHNNITNGYCGIDLYFSHLNNIYDNYFSEIFVPIYGEYSHDDNITGNIINSSSKDGITLWYSSKYNIKGNKMTGGGIWIGSDLLENWISNNIDTLNTVNGKPVYYWKNQIGGTIPTDAGEIILANCTKVTIENQNLINGSVGILLGFSSYNYINGNNASNHKWGIYLILSNENLIVNNTAYFNSGNGIGLGTSNRNMVVDNTLSSNQFGISIYSSTKNNIFKNNISNNDFDGMFLYNSFENNITGNIFYKNDRYGVWPRQSDANNITRNIFYQNKEYGVYFLDSSNNYIYHNNMIKNTNQAYDNRDDNYFDNGYPSAGNYWDNYFGVDNYRGVNQNIPGSDGIGDSPYVIDSNTRDNYPLIRPYKSYEGYIILKEGWNLISTPLIQNNQNLKEVLKMIDGYYDAIQWYDITDTNDPWKHYKVGKPFGNDLSEINETMGFWVHITQPGRTIFLYIGAQPTQNQFITLHPGWNLVGYPSLKSYNRTNGLNNLTFGQEVDSIWTYDAATQKWKEIGSSDYFKLRRGYWIHAKTTCVWEVPL